MNIWRINLKTEPKKGVDPRGHCLNNGIVGLGWKVADWQNEPMTSKNYMKFGTKIGYHGRGWKAATNAIHNRMKIDDLIWTRDRQGNYYVGRITSDWYYDNSQEAVDADIVNVRKCDWHKIGTVETVPGKVVSSFRVSSTVQMVGENVVKEFSKILYNEKSQSEYYEIQSLKEKDIFSLLSAEDCEDALALYLQVEHNYMIIPSSCKTDTLAYEFELKHRITGKKAVCQVKSGHTGLDANGFQKIESDIYLFATSGNYNKREPKSNIHFVEPETIKQFLYNNQTLLPEKIKIWVDLTQNIPSL